jgi:hypothetical protein
LNRLAGGRFFPGIHHHALFTVEESVDRFSVSLRSRDGRSNVAVRGHLTGCWPRSSIFTSTEEASNFFRAGSLGYSGTGSLDRFDGMELRCRDWHVEPLNIDELHSSVFEDEKRFPKGSIEFDCALLMRNIEHEWHGVPELCCGPAA